MLRICFWVCFILYVLVPVTSWPVEIWNSTTVYPPFNNCSELDTTYWQYTYHPYSIQYSSDVNCDSGFAYVHALTGIVSSYPGMAGDRWTKCNAWIEHNYFTPAMDGNYKVKVGYTLRGFFGLFVPRVADPFGKQAVSTQGRVYLVVTYDDPLFGWTDVLNVEIYGFHNYTEHTGSLPAVAWINLEGVVYESSPFFMSKYDDNLPWELLEYRVGLRLHTTNHLWTRGDGYGWSAAVFLPKPNYSFGNQTYNIDGIFQVDSFTVQLDPMDLTPPTTTANPGNYLPLCPPNFRVDLTCSDTDGHGGPGYGVAGAWWWYQDDPSQKHAYTTSATVPMPVDRAICFYSQDRVGNVEPVRCLSYEVYPIPGPTLSYPDQGGTGVPLSALFFWNASQWGSQYQIQVDDDADFSSLIWSGEFPQNTTLPTMVPLPSPGVYHWRVRTLSSACGLYGEWSEVWWFLAGAGGNVFLECPPDQDIPAYTTIETLPLDGFTITNTSSAPAAIEYQCTAVGPATLSDNGNPASLSGTTPILQSAESYIPPDASLVIPEIRTPSSQVVTYRANIVGQSGQEYIGTTTISFTPPVATVIKKFQGRALKDHVELTWEISSDDNIVGICLYRRSSNETEFIQVNKEPLPASDNLYNDYAAENGSSYDYNLLVIFENGNEIQSHVITVEIEAHTLALHQNHPNPFNPSTTISFTLPETMNARLSIYDVEGRLVKLLVDQRLGKGYKEFIWDATDHSGTKVSTGVYFYQLTAGNNTLTRKALLLK